MEEVDNIIIHTFREIGCDLDEDVVTLRQFTPELVVEASVRCLKLIDTNTNLPHSLPPGMSARFRLGTDLANALQSLGFRGDMGYQTFLYPNEADIRRLMMFLVEKLPKESVTSTDEPQGTSAMLSRRISSEIARQLQSPWVPPPCKRRSIRWVGPKQWHKEGASGSHAFRSIPLAIPTGLGDLTKQIPKDIMKYYNKHMPLVKDQPARDEDLAPSLLEFNAASVTAAQEWETEWNTTGLPSRLSQEEYKARKRERLQKRMVSEVRQGLQKSEQLDRKSATADLMQMLDLLGQKSATKGTKGSRFTHTEKLQFAQDDEKTAAQIGIGEGGPRADTEEELRQKREDEQTDLKEQLSRLMTQLEGLETESKQLGASVQQMEEQTMEKKRSNSEKEASYKVKKKTIDLLPNAETNITLLQGVVEKSAQQLVSLATQWEEHRGPLIEEYRKTKDEVSNKESESEKRLEDIQALREKMKKVAEETRSKEDMLKQLVAEYERMAKDVNRSAYTRRILEIVANIRKQKEDINKVLGDTRTLQKEINQVSGKLDRTFTVTDELIFRDAKKDEAVRKAYKYLAALHENFDQLIKTLEETGTILREIRELEDQIDTESSKKTVTNLEKITNDYKQMKQENAALIAKLKGQ
ncbi:coiled-coil domain-containing protein 22 homolog [Strongylocentrotus purpuratus]|uniref:Coiled-coil domain-containing protein 22 homolog n=1 Tax=Strongylocentrotus purpuratus TaxID=7668 RepID=A0A7M7NM56_STRPU|nr:coiled-coil domain-containing protein 22 homolog [Strongylocentrotus purpuratus]